MNVHTSTRVGRPLRSVATAWLINAGAFWLAEVLTSPTPTDAEPLWVLLAALAAYLAIGAAGGGAWVLLGRRLGAGRGASYAFAFLPGVVLIFPVVRYAFYMNAGDAAVLLALLAVAAVVLAFAWRRAARADAWAFDTAYACGSLALWSIALSARNIASEVPLTAPTIVAATSTLRVAVVVLYLVGLALALLASASTAVVASLSAVVLGTAAARVVVPPHVASFAHAASADPQATESHSAVPVVLIILDTTRVDHLSVYGYSRPTTPALQAFAEGAVVFDDAIAPSPWTLPSHASLFTGLFPLRHGADRPHWLSADDTPGALRPGLPLDARHPTLAAWLRDHGYDTGAVMANFGYLDPAFGLDRGFTFYEAAPNTPVMPRVLSLVDRRITPVPWASRYWRSYRRAEQVNRVALAWLAGRRSNAVFLALNYMEPHRPWTAPGRGYGAFAAEREEPATRVRPRSLGPELRRLVDLYDSQVAALDHALGALFDGLRALDLYDRSLIIVTADHGESLGENGIVGHGQSLHAPELSIPLLVKYPSSAHTGRRAGPVQLVDVFPTIAAALGFDVPPDLDGEPFDRVHHPILAEFYTDPRAAEDGPRGYQVALYEGARKLVLSADGGGAVFDVEHDPSESNPIPLPPPSPLAERQAWLLDRHQTLERDLRASSEAAAPIDPNVQKALRALGYVGR
jgi:arylsulfatase A-like enzyme